MNRKTIQEQRKRRYFIEAAKKIIKEEGIENLTVKKVADLAVFAPGTLYNYFEDLNDLFGNCAGDFWEECRDYVLESADNKQGIKQEIIVFSRAYCEYFIKNPNVFELIFLKKFDVFSEEAPEPPEIALCLHNTLKQGVGEGLIAKEELEIIENLIGGSIHGHLLFYIKKRTKANKEEILKLVEKEVEYVLNKS